MAIMKDTHRFLHFNLEASSGEDNHYVDIAKLLSQANRRSYRQGMVYHVANIVFDDAEGDADIDVCTAPNTWYTQRAWQLGFSAWLEQNQAAARAIGLDSLGKWSDFKVYLNDDMSGDADQATLIDVNGNTFPVGEWDYSNFVIPNDGGASPTTCEVYMMGNRAGTFPAQTKVSLLQQFEYIMTLPQEDPDVGQYADLGVYTLMSKDSPDSETLMEVVKDIETDNDMPPYDHDKIPGSGTAGTNSPSSPWVARTCMIKGGASTSSPVAAVGGFAAPCGLLMIETNTSVSDNSIGVTIELVPGEYKGVHAYPMRGGGF